jgi:hypothetical protein
MGNQCFAPRLTLLLTCTALVLTQSGCAARHSAGWTAAPTNFNPQTAHLAAPVEEAPAPQRPGSVSGETPEGIKIHGHWTIDVRDPNGWTATHREFENALPVGAHTIAPMLGRSSTLGLWRVFASYPGGTDGPCLNPGPAPCYVIESSDPLTGSNFIHSLTISTPLVPDPDAGKMTLSGSFTVRNAGQITVVATVVNTCAPTVAPAMRVNDDYRSDFDP